MIHRIRNSVPLFFLMIIFLLSACITTPVSVTSSTTPMNDKKVTVNYGPVQGSHRTYSVFGLWMIDRPDIDKAIQNAIQQKGGDALINVTCYEKTAYFILFSMHTVVVEGEAVSFNKENPVIDLKKQFNKGMMKNIIDKAYDKKEKESK
jgi:hypothetical protein